MKLPKQIIKQFVSWIDLKDVREYVEQLKGKTIKNSVFGSLPLIKKIKQINNFDFEVLSRIKNDDMEGVK